MSATDGTKIIHRRTPESAAMLANVKRELGEYEDAISRYEEVLNFRPNEFGVSIALLQTLTESSWKSLELGLYNDCIELARKAIFVATSLALERVDIFNLWKGVGDACSLFAYVKAKSGRLPISETFTLLSTQLEPTAFEILADVDEAAKPVQAFPGLPHCISAQRVQDDINPLLVSSLSDG